MAAATGENGSILGKTVPRDLIAGAVVFLVALPLCLGVAKASDAEPIAGMIAGIVGGLVVGILSRSHTSVSGPAAGLTAVVAAQIHSLGSYDAFLLAVLLAGFIQIVLGCVRAGFLAAYFPMSVIRGLLTAIGVILILKQLPHLIGRDTDPEGDLAFLQHDHQNAFTELLASFLRFHPGAALVGLSSLAFLIAWDRIKVLKKSIVPAPFVVVLFGVALSEFLHHWGPLKERWRIGVHHLVQVPVADSVAGMTSFIHSPDFSQLGNWAIYVAAITIAIVASLETLLNLEAVDKLDPRRRHSPPSRELFSQGVGNVVCGLLGGIPVTSVIVRSSVNINAGSVTKLSAIFHGALLLGCLAFIPTALNRIPLSCLAAILMMTGFKLASPKIVKEMWDEGLNRFLPYVITVVAIVMTDLLIGVLVGLAVSIAFILYSNFQQPLRHVVEQHAAGDVHRFEFGSQVSFLNRVLLDTALRRLPRGAQILLDARNAVYIDPDVVDFIKEFQKNVAPMRGMTVSFLGFGSDHNLADQIEYVDFSSRDLQRNISPAQVLDVLKRGNKRFREGRPLTRHYERQVTATAAGQFPLAAVLSCIDSRSPAEILFDLGLGDIFSARIAGNIISDRVLGSLEYACKVAGAKLVVVLGHTRCGAVGASVDFLESGASVLEKTGCEHIASLTTDIQTTIDEPMRQRLRRATPEARPALVDDVARMNVERVVKAIKSQSHALAELARTGQIVLVGAMYNVATGEVTWLNDSCAVA